MRVCLHSALPFENTSRLPEELLVVKRSMLQHLEPTQRRQMCSKDTLKVKMIALAN